MSSYTTYKIPQKRGYSTSNYYIEDISQKSPNYFNIEYFPTVVSGGRHIIKLKGNGINLRLNKTIDIEVVDANGVNIFCEVLDYVDRFNNYYIAIEIYDITARGIATAYFVGEAIYDLSGKVIPTQYQNKDNVRWKKSFNVLPFERNTSELIFDKPPSVNLAQIVTPAKILTQLTSSAYNFAILTSSVGMLNIQTANFTGYDRDTATSANIVDPRLQGILANPNQVPTTTNTVITSRREIDNDIQNGYVINLTTRFNTRLLASQSFFTKQHLGGYFEFYNSESTPRNLSPALPSGITVLGNIHDQLSKYTASIVEVVSDTQAILSDPIRIVTVDSNTIAQNYLSQFTYKQANTFTGSITYVPSSTNYITSSVVSQSYVELTFNDLNPISGQVYRIRTSARLGTLTGDYKILNDQRITPVEYLTDAEYPNTENYLAQDSDYRMIGHFTTESILDTYWTVLRENSNGFDVVTGSLDNKTLINSVVQPAGFTQSSVITTAYNQNYNINQTYTVSFYLTLDPHVELEFYMNSDILNTYIVAATPYPKAFIKSRNVEKTRYKEDQTRFGKYVGKVVNDRSTRKYYGKIMFDFQTDGEGLGSPVFRTKIKDYVNITGSAYLSEISIKPYALNGFTPNIVQYAIPLPQEYVEAAALSQSIDIKLDYFDYTGRQSEYSTYLDDILLNLKADIVSNTCQTDKLYLQYNNSYT